MLTFIAFVLTLAGCINWLLIGVLQYDFIAGLFGFQGSIFSRIIYIFFGIGAVYLTLRVIINKGTFKIYEKRKKKTADIQTNQVSQQENSSQNETTNNSTNQNQPAYVNIEASEETIPQTQEKPKKKKKWWKFWEKDDKKSKKSKKIEKEEVSENAIQIIIPQNTENMRQNTTESETTSPQSETLSESKTIQQTNTNFTQDNLFDEHLHH